MSGQPPPPPLGGDQDRGPTINIVNWTFTAVAALCVVLRLFGRLRLTNNVGWDDFWIFVSIVSVPTPEHSPHWIGIES